MAKARLSLYYLVDGMDLTPLGERMIAIDKAVKALQQKYDLDGEEPDLTRFGGKDSVSVGFIQDQEVVRKALEELVKSEDLIPNIVNSPGIYFDAIPNTDIVAAPLSYWRGKREDKRNREIGFEITQEVLDSVDCLLKPIYDGTIGGLKLPLLSYLRHYIVERKV